MLVELLCATVLSVGIANADVACQYAPVVINAAQTYQVQPLMLVALIEQESNWKVDARGKAGEIGLGQILTKNKEKAKKVSVPEENILATARYLSEQDIRYRSIEKGLQSYNAGHPTAKAEKYARSVLRKYYRLRAAHRKLLQERTWQNPSS